MNIAFSTNFLNLRAPKELIDISKSAQIIDIEIWTNDGCFMNIRSPNKIQNSLIDEGINILSVHAPFPDGGLIKKGEITDHIKLFKEVCKKCSRLGASYLVYHAPVLRNEVKKKTVKSKAKSIKLWNKISKLADDFELKIAFENLPSNKAWPLGLNISETKEITECIHTKNAGFCLDLSHYLANNEYVGYEEILSKQNLLLIHASDSLRHHDLHLPPGEGEHGWGKFLKYFRIKCSDTPLILEVKSPYLDGKLLRKIMCFMEGGAEEGWKTNSSRRINDNRQN